MKVEVAKKEGAPWKEVAQNVHAVRAGGVVVDEANGCRACAARESIYRLSGRASAIGAITKPLRTQVSVLSSGRDEVDMLNICLEALEHLTTDDRKRVIAWLATGQRVTL